MISPIFSGVHSRSCLSLRTYAAGSQVELRLEKLDVTNGHPVASIEEAEDYVLGSGPTMHINHPDVAALAITIMRAASNIAARSRRGAGNTLLMHPNLLHRILASPFASNNEDEFQEPATVGRWTSAGKLNGMEVYTSPHMRDGRAVVMFLGGETDRPAFLFGIDGQLVVKLLPTLSTAMGNYSDFICTVAGPIAVSLWIRR